MTTALLLFPGGSLQVDEAQTRVRLQADTLHVSLAVMNSGHVERASVRFEVLDSEDGVRGTSTIQVALRLGLNHLQASIPVLQSGQSSIAAADFMWYRLRYRIAPQSGSAGGTEESIDGILSLSEIAPQIFELSATSFGFAKPGSAHFVRIRARHPITNKPVGGVAVEGVLIADEESSDVELRTSGTTNKQGLSTLKFQLPTGLTNNEEITLQVVGRLGTYAATVSSGLRVAAYPTVLLNTDKPIYQPGQMLHGRVLAFDMNKRALARQPVTFKLLDPDNTLVYRVDGETSEHGIASTTWTLSENLRLGQYRLQVELGDGSSGASTHVRIGRYELPTFVVTARPDRAFYLPGQHAEIEVAADYLFGEPVRNGKARVVRESGREWNYKLQKWEIEEDEAVECAAESGRCKVRFDLAEAHEDLSDNDYTRFRDLRFAAYVTDTTTGRTEQRRFDVRITRDPIHIYVIEQHGTNRDDFPAEFFISTFYADGRPAECAVEISAVFQETKYGLPEPQRSHRFLHEVRTNRYGVAKVSRLWLPDDGRFDDYLAFRARDRHGAIGRHTEGFYLYDRDVIRVSANKALYREGEPVEVQLFSNLALATVTVDAVRDGQVLATTSVRLRNGKGFTVFPARKEFFGEVTFVAHAVGAGDDDAEATAQGWRVVLFPRNDELKLDVRFTKASYRPGEAARANVQLRSADGMPVKGALGLAVIDRAVEERARIDEEFGRGGGFFGFRDSWYAGGEIAGVRRADLDKLDMTQPLPAGFDLVAEALLQAAAGGVWLTTARSDSEPDLLQRFNSLISPHALKIKEALAGEYSATREYPKSEAALLKMLAMRGVDFAKLRDPWGTRYSATFSVWQTQEKMELVSAGPDKRFDTDDDFRVEKWAWSYFKPHQAAFAAAVRSHHERTGGYIRDADTLKAELKRHRVEFDALRDPWNRPYRLRFGIDGSNLTLAVLSDGPDGRISNDDFAVASTPIDYFEYQRGRIDSALAGFIHERNRFPAGQLELEAALRAMGIEWESLRDPWDRPYYAVFQESGRYADNVVIQSFADASGQTQQRAGTQPVTQSINWVYFRSSGPDGTAGTPDDFNVASFSRIFSQRASSGNVMTPQAEASLLTGSTGSITGFVTDVTDAVIAGADVKADRTDSDESFTARTDEGGRYVLRNLPPGFYHVRVSMMGFKDLVVTSVPVRSSSVTQLNARLQVGEVTATVTVEASAVVLETAATSLALDSIDANGKRLPAELRHSQALATPRLRKYFPETLLWQPELVTDARGRTTLTFPLADSITTWKLTGVASTLDGRIGTVEKEIRAFQPFFVEHDPPQFLTVGDEIALPVVLRNYLDRPLAMNLSVTQQPWFQSIGRATSHTQVPAGGTQRELFPLRAMSPVNKGLHRVIAAERQLGDAVEKSVTVRPYGEERVATVTQVLRDRVTLELHIPDNVLPNSIRAELKIYPNHIAHLMESIEAVMSRPYGCGEQTISSAYPSVLLLKYAPSAEPAVQKRARRYVQIAYERLLSYRAPSGGFTYWGRGEPDVALTAYALRFLTDARAFVAADDALATEAHAWLLKQISANGSWEWRGWSGSQDPQRTAIQTAYVARVLTAYGASRREKWNVPAQAAHANTMRRAFEFLESAAAQFDEPYMLASLALASRDAGRTQLADQIAARLVGMAHHENGGMYWTLKSNTPFYGWGLAGRVETTALVVRTLLQGGGAEGSAELVTAADRGLLFLLRAKDRYGVWYSTQSTVNVLEALLDSVTRTKTGANTSRTATIVVNGKPAGSVELPTGSQVSAPLTVDVAAHLHAGANRVEVVRDSTTSSATVQVVAASYVPWPQSPPAATGSGEAASADGLRFSVGFDKTGVEVGGQVRCTARAERVGHRGYGMMLAEIGLPPGAEVDRASLERAMEASNWGIGRYDVLPDRVILYLWPRAGGVNFTFTLRPRFGMSAKTGASILYDYYNPEERAVVPPTHFTAHEPRRLP